MTDEGYKKAALKLYGLAEADRSWLLGRVEAGQRDMLLRLISQLEAMGLESSVSSAVALDAGSAMPGADVVDATDRSREGAQRDQRVDAASVEAVAKVLLKEPPWLVALVLDLEPWRWAHSFLSAQPADRRAAIGRYRNCTVAVKPRVREALVEELAARMRDAGSAGSAFDGMLDQESRHADGKGKRFWQGFVKWKH